MNADSRTTKTVTTRECFAKAHALLTRMHYGGIDFFQSQECTNLMHEFFVMDTRRGEQPDEPAECKDCDKLMTERDDATEQADKLAECIEGLLGIEIGEHSSGNAPWQNAIDAAEYELDKRKRNAETKE